MLCGRAEDVSCLQLLSYVPLHAAARAPDVWSDSGLQLSQVRKKVPQGHFSLSYIPHLKMYTMLRV